MYVSGACISGEIRTFFAPCVGAQIRDNLLLPLKLRTHVFMNQRSPTNGTVDRVRAVLSGVDLAALEVEYLPHMERPTCPVKGTIYPLTRGLVKCFHSFHLDTKRYTWIVRIRSDHMVPFRLTSLPCAACYYNAHPWASGIVLSASLSDCTCGWVESPCNNNRTYCDWADDQFALLHGSAIQSYFGDLRYRFCDHHFLGLQSQTDLSYLDTERRMARMLRNVTVHDMRFISCGMHPRLQRTFKCHAANDGRLPARTYPTFRVPSRSIKTVLPTGPWDQRRSSVCHEQRKLPRRKRYLCLRYGPTDDDIQHEWKPHYSRLLEKKRREG
jgi:hypothetical protein